jgi:hypothetical protein
MTRIKFNKEQVKKIKTSSRSGLIETDSPSPLIFVDRPELGDWSIRVSRRGATVTIAELIGHHSTENRSHPKPAQTDNRSTGYRSLNTDFYR